MLTTQSWLVVGTGAALGAAFIGYCIYFDQKRRSDPDFKRKLKEKRANARQKKRDQSRKKNQLPNFSDPMEVQSCFLQEVQLGEEMLAEGDYENAVEHLSIAITLCNQPQQLLHILQNSLPPQVFTMLLERLPETGARVAQAASRSMPASTMPVASMLEGEGIRLTEDSELE